MSFAPATVGNVGPCYDIMGLSLNYVGDFAEVVKTGDFTSELLWGSIEGPMKHLLQDVSYRENTAWIVANDLWEKVNRKHKIDFGVKLKLHKYMPIGTGLGSSACSAVSAAHALLSLLSIDLPKEEIIESLQLGEEHSSGTGHPDNVVPSYYGGFYFMMIENYDNMDGGEKRMYELEYLDDLVCIIVRPDECTVTTKVAREEVRKYLENTFLEARGLKASDLLKVIREQSVKAADMILSCQKNDIKRIGAILRNNDFLETPRSKLIPKFKEVKDAALKAGAYGCSISGSGPSMVAITDELTKANEIRLSMQKAFGNDNSKWLISKINREGAKTIDNIENFIAEASAHTDMMTFS
jgi:homoserine kinase